MGFAKEGVSTLHGSVRRRHAILLLTRGLVLAPWVAVHAQNLAAQDSSLIRSMGLPQALKPYGAAAFGIDNREGDSRAVAHGAVGVYHDLLNPAMSAAGLSLEGYGGVLGSEFDAGLRLFVGSPALRLHFGVDYSLTDTRLDFAVAVSDPVRRGGLLGGGSGLRIVWAPLRGAFEAGISVPLFQPFAGRTRFRKLDRPPPRAPAAPDPEPLSPDSSLREVLASLRESALWISRMTSPSLPRGPPEFALKEDSAMAAHIVVGDSLHPPGHTPALEEAEFHRELELAFGSVTTADAARRILLDQILLPFNRDFGRARNSDFLKALRSRALQSFQVWADSGTVVPIERRGLAAGIFDALLGTVQEVADSARMRWGDSRLIWLPFQLALRPEEHDGQSELDQLIGQVTGSEVLPGHDLVYATDERFQAALLRTIQQARDYHVLWIHDFAGKAENDRPDSTSMRIALDGYLKSLTDAAAGYDRTRVIPTYLIFLDQYYYQRNKAGFWLSLLEDPLRREIHSGDSAVDYRVRAAQAALREAVANSAELKAATERHGQDWLRSLISVHVSVTNPPDPSFRSRVIVGGLTMALPDDIMRDHRKIAFADITESDPGKGIALLTGLGVGEHYARFQWLDRTIVVSGPAAVTLKTEARQLLLSQGFRPEQIPRVLQPAPEAPDYYQRIKELERRGWFARAAIALNETGYGAKHSSAAKATLYSLMPAGSTIIVSDPQWLSRFWGGMLLGAALRGCHVLVVGPGVLNTAFDGSPVQLSLQRDLFVRLLQAREILKGGLEVSHGWIQLGLFSVGLGTYNVAGGVRAVRDGLRRNPFLLEALPFDTTVVQLFMQADKVLKSLGANLPDTVETYHPRFHLKTQFLGTPSAMKEVIGRPEYAAFFARRIRERLSDTVSAAGTDITLDHLSMFRSFLDHRSPEERERQALYLTVGSHNQDQRSLLLDGEATCIVSGEASLLAAGDMLLLTTAGVVWLSDPEEVRRLLPAPSRSQQGLAWLTEGIF